MSCWGSHRSQRVQKSLRRKEKKEGNFWDFLTSTSKQQEWKNCIWNFEKLLDKRFYEDGNACMTWDKVKKKFDPVSDSTFVKTERFFRESNLGKNQDPEIWLNLEVMGPDMTDEKFLIPFLISSTNDYELQMTLMETWIGDKMNPLCIDELKEDLNLRCERLSSKPESTKFENFVENFVEERALLSTHFKGKCRNCGKLIYRSAQCKSKMVREAKKEVICNYCK
jgi:hypothetical protein